MHIGWPLHPAMQAIHTTDGEDAGSSEALPEAFTAQEHSARHPADAALPSRSASDPSAG